MKVTVDPTIPHLSEEELELLKEDGLIKESTPAELKQHILGKDIIISSQVEEFLKKEGISVDELVAGLLKQTKAAN